MSTSMNCLFASTATNQHVETGELQYAHVQMSIKLAKTAIGLLVANNVRINQNKLTLQS